MEGGVMNVQKVRRSNRNSKQMEITVTDDEDLGGLVTGSLRLGGLHLLEELLEDPHQGLIVFGAKDFGDKGPSFCEKLAGQLERHEGEMS